MTKLVIPDWNAPPPKWEPRMENHLVPQRHVCGEILQADMSSEYVLWYPRFDTKGEGAPLVKCPACNYPLGMAWTRRLYLVEPMRYDLAVVTAGHRVCSNCWGQLEISPLSIGVWDDDMAMILTYNYVLCNRCDYETRAYVTHRYVGYARQQDYVDYGRAIIGLAEALELTEADGLPINLRPPVKRTTNELLTELGF